MNQRPKPTEREARVGRCSPAGNADWNKKMLPAATQGASFGGVGSGKLENRYLAELGTTSGCHRFDKKQVTQIGTQIPGSGNGKWNPKALAGGEIPADAFAENSGDGQESATGSLGSSYGDSGFQGFLEPTPTITDTIKHSNSRYNSKHEY